MLKPKTLIVALLASAPWLAPGCDSSRPVAPLRDGPTECADLAAYCKAPAAAFGEPYASCYKTGKAKINNACINAYYDCIDECRSAGATLPNAGAGGEGGGDSAPDAHAGAGGQGGAAGGSGG